MRTTYLATFTLGRPGQPPPSIDAVLAVCREWLLHPREGVDLGRIEGLDLGATGDHPIGAKARLRIVRVGESSTEAYGLRLRHPHGDDPGAVWQTDACFASSAGVPGMRAAVSTALGRSEGVITPLAAPVSRPRLVPNLVAKFGARDKYPLLPVAKQLLKSDVPHFVEMLSDPDRRTPVIFCSATTMADKPIVNAARIAEGVVGLAHVYYGGNR